MSPIKVAVIGTGGFGTGRAHAYRNTEGFELACGCRRSAEGRKAFEKQFGVPAYEDWRQAIALPEVDAVSVATPTAHHFQVLLAALQAGKHVLAESPPAVSPQEMQDLISLAKEKQLVFHVGSNYRFAGEAQAIAQALPELGQVLTAEGISMWGAERDNWHLDTSLSGSLFLSVHYYHIDLFLGFLGDVESVQAAYVQHPVQPPMGIGAIILAFRSGALATIHGGIGPGALGSRLVGTKGSFENSQGFTLYVGAQKKDIPVKPLDTLKRDCEDFREKILGNLDWLPDATHHLKAVTVAHLAWKSAQEGRRLSVPAGLP